MLLSGILALDDWLLTLWVAARHGVDPLLLVAVGWRETNWGRRGAGKRGWHLGYGYFPGSPVLERYRGLRNQLEGAASQLARDLGATPTSQSQLRRFASESWRPADPGAWAKGVWQAYCALTDDLSLLLGERPRHPGPLTGGRAQERAATRTP